MFLDCAQTSGGSAESSNLTCCRQANSPTAYCQTAAKHECWQGTSDQMTSIQSVWRLTGDDAIALSSNTALHEDKWRSQRHIV
jgi:hypothetical protein